MIVIESDSRVAVSWVLDGDYGNLALLDVIYDIRSMLRDSSNVSICFVSRSSNEVADSLAKRGSMMDGEVVEWLVL